MISAGKNRAAGAEELEKAVAAVDPAERRQVQEAGECRGIGELQPNGSEIIRQRQYALAPDQSIDLHPERNERDEINHAQSAEKHCTSDDEGFIGIRRIGSEPPPDAAPILRRRNVFENRPLR